MIFWTTPCPTCARGVRVEVRTDGDGRTLPDLLLDACEHERKRRGVCKLCPRPVWGTVGRSIYCEAHRDRVRQRNMRRWYRQHADSQRAKRRARYEENAEAEKADRRERYHADIEAGRQRLREQRAKRRREARERAAELRRRAA